MPSLLVVDDDRSVRHLIQRIFADSEFTVLVSETVESALQTIADESPDVLLLDILLPGISGLDGFSRIQAIDSRLPVIFITASGTSDTAIEAMKLGAYDYLMKPLDVAQVMQIVRQAANIRQLMRVPVQVGDLVAPDDQGDQIVGRSAVMQEVFKAIGRVAGQNVSVLIRGESGTGKELVARAIYQHSDRSQLAFLAINCAAIPEQLLESELFGHEKGAFTGADRQKIGKFEQCNHGTIFLDEIGDMAPLLQSKVLRLLQQQEFQRIGGSEMVKTDVRVIAATNRPLETMVSAGTFREDLLYRLNGYTINLPPLRERGDDIVLLVQHILARLSKDFKKKVTSVPKETLEALRTQTWPGNIRELEGVLRQALLQTTGTVLSPEFLPRTTLPKEVNPTSPIRGDLPKNGRLPHDLSVFLSERISTQSTNLYAETLETMERFLLAEVLTLSEGNQSEASRLLGITRGSLRNKIRTLGITIDSRIDPGGEPDGAE